MTYHKAAARREFASPAYLLVRHGSAVLLLAAVLSAGGCEGAATTAAKPAAKKPAATQPAATQPAATSQPPAADQRPAAAAELPPQVTVERIMRLMEQGKVEEASAAVQDLILQRPDDPEALFVAGRILAARGNLAQAVDVLDSIKAADPTIELAVAGQSAEWLLQQGRLSSAEARLLNVVRAAPDNPMVHRLLLRIYNAQGRRFEADKHVRAVVESGSFQLGDLAMLCSIETPFHDEQLEAVMINSPTERTYWLTQKAREQLTILHDYDEAAELLRSALEAGRNREAWVWLGFTLAMDERWDELRDWLDPKSLYFPRFKGVADHRHDEHPQFWNTLGLWLDHLGKPQQAISAYVKALELDPRSLHATQQIADNLAEQGHIELAEQFRQRAYRIGRNNELVRDVLSSQMTPENCRELAASYGSLGLELQADAWAKVAQSLPPGGVGPNAATPASTPPASTPPAATPAVVDLDTTGGESSSAPEEFEPLLLPDMLAAVAAIKPEPVDLAALSTARGQPPTQPATTPTQPSDPSTDFRLTDVAAEVGLGEAEYDWGRAVGESGVIIPRSTGGGVAALDYDLDGFPDLYFSRAGGNPDSPKSNKPKQLFRNVDGERFELVDAAGAGDIGYGQGLSAGDFDQDGFPDLLVANIGSCRLYHNNGDGSYSLHRELPLRPGNHYAAAVTLADLNRDSLPDAFIATYLGGSEYETKQCLDPQHGTTACPPQSFPGGEDYVFLNDGSGGWSDAADLLSGPIDAGRSLAAVVGDLDGSGGNDVYVSNDTTGNHLYLNRVEGEGGVTLQQRAGAAGVAVDLNGRTQGSMGVAVADLDGNGLEDIYVTNAHGEYNALYVQQRPGLYFDRTREWNLFQDALPLVGFGCQFADLDDDGREDLLVVNGNVEDYRYRGEQFAMPPLVYRHAGSRMEPVPAASVGAYLAEPMLARGLATLDFDGDGRTDFAVTHADRPAALLKNETGGPHRHIELELIGVACDRDAVGARVTVEAGGKKLLQSVVAGEGYFSSNERTLHFGLGEAERVDNLTIEWPDGQRQEIPLVEANKRYLVVQSSPPVER